MSLVVSKAIRLVDLVAEGVDTLAEIANRAEMSRSTTHRLLTTLVRHNYLSFEGHRYALGNRLFELGAIRRRSFDFVETLRPVLSRYAQETRDTIHLAILDGQDILLIDRVFGDRQLRINSYPGLRTPAYSTAVGKVLIGHLPSSTWPDYVKALPENYVRSSREILDDFARAKRTNVGIDIDECNIGTCGIASSFVFDTDRRIACSINGATVYFADGRLEALAGTVLQLASELKHSLTKE